MPVIRGEIKVRPLTTRQRKTLLKQLVKELAGEPTTEGPIIFEIPLEQSDRRDVLVVWDAMGDLRSEDRTDLILEAYKPRADKIAQAVGVTRREAIEHGWLPYQVKPASIGPSLAGNLQELKKAMLDQGGFVLDGDNVVLRLPSFAMAEYAAQRLMSRVPEQQWYIEQVNP